MQRDDYPGSGEGVSVVVPAHNETEGISATLEELTEVLEGVGRPFQLLVVNDGSTDDTPDLAREAGAEVLSLPRNVGYGGALKAGIARARFDTIVIIDADGTYPAGSVPDLLSFSPDFEMVVGARTGDDVHIQTARRLPKWFLGKLAGYLAGQRIPDLNSGLRVVSRGLVQRFEHLLPSGFSFTTTLTLAALSSDIPVQYHPIDYRPRLGDSKIRPFHAFDFLMLILRTVVFFNPLKVFLPVGSILFMVGFGKSLWDLFLFGDFSDTVVMGFLGAVIVWSVGLLSDQIARVALSPRIR